MIFTAVFFKKVTDITAEEISGTAELRNDFHVSSFQQALKSEQAFTDDDNHMGYEPAKWS